MSKRVRATEIGYYGGALRQPGEEFTLDSDKAFSEIWMEALDGKAPKAAKAEKPKEPADSDGANDGGTKAEGAKTPDEVIAMADDGTPFMKFKAEAKKLLGDDAPAKKDDLVAALKKL